MRLIGSFSLKLICFCVVGAATLALTSCGASSNGAAKNFTDTLGTGGNSGMIVVPMIPKGGNAPELFRMKPDGTGLLQLTQASGKGLPTDANDFPVIAPGGGRIYFASGRDRQPESVTHDHDPMYRVIYVMNSDGSGVHRLTSNPASNCVEYPDDVSPDGLWVVFEMACTGAVVPADLAGVSKIYRISKAGKNQEMIAPKSTLSTSPLYGLGSAAYTGDGKVLVFAAQAPTATEFWKMDWATLKMTQLTNTAKQDRIVNWRKPMMAPGKNRMYFETYGLDSGIGQVESINLDGTGSKVLITIPNDPQSDAMLEDRFALSPDGYQFVFLHGLSKQSVMISPLNGLHGKSITPASSPFIGWGNLAWR